MDAVTGKQIWLSEDAGPPDTEILSSPLVTGPAGHQVVVYGDLKGKIEVLSLATGALLYSYQTKRLRHQLRRRLGGQPHHRVERRLPVRPGARRLERDAAGDGHHQPDLRFGHRQSRL